jgi:ABC-type branched-subunit amino acid transport system substrate-binding protein
MQVKTIVSYAVNGLGMDRFAILYPDEHYGRRFMNLFWDEILPYGGRVVGIESYNPNEADFGDPIKKLVGLYYEVPEDLKEIPEPLSKEEEKEPEPIIDFDAVFIPDSPEKAGLLIPQLTYYDVVDVYLMGTNLWQSDQLINMAGQYMQGAIMADGFFASSRSDTVKRFTEMFQKIYGHQPGFIEAITYDTAMMIFDMVNRPEIASRSVLKDALLDISGYSGITGLTSFTEDGDSQKRLYLLRVKGDGFIEVDH